MLSLFSYFIVCADLCDQLLPSLFAEFSDAALIIVIETFEINYMNYLLSTPGNCRVFVVFCICFRHLA